MLFPTNITPEMKAKVAPKILFLELLNCFLVVSEGISETSSSRGDFMSVSIAICDKTDMTSVFIKHAINHPVICTCVMFDAL